MPVLNDTVRVSAAASFSGINTQLTGANYVWDYTFLEPDSQRVIKFEAPVSTPYPFFALNAKYGVRNYSPDPFPFILFGGAPENVYDFYTISSANYRQTGYGITAMAASLPIFYNKPDIIYTFPLNYGKVDSSQSGFGYPMPGLGFYGIDKNRLNVADGWGKLKLPYGEFDAVRVKSTINQSDTIYLDTLGIGMLIPRPTRHEYKWMGKGSKIPLLQIDETDFGFGLVTINRVEYQDSMLSAMSAQIISTPTCPGAKKGTMEVISHGGKAPHVYSWNSGQTTTYLSGLEEGVYSVTVTDQYGDTITLIDSVEGKKQSVECLIIPSAFTPNDDGVNEVWNIPGLSEFSDCRVEIYNRWGSLLYSSTGYTKPWDGKYNGENSSTGTYYYTIKVQSNMYQGTVTIIR